MSEKMVLSIIAEDRPGLVQTLSQVVTDHAGNWIDSSMARLGGEFAGIVRVDVPNDNVDAFESALAVLATTGIVVSVRHDKTGMPALTGRRADLELTGSDHPGIVHEISSALASQNVSIEELKTEIFSGSMSGGKLFSAKARVVFPNGLGVDDLRHHLEKIAEDIMVDIDLTEADD